MKVLFVSSTPPAEAGGSHGFISTVKAALEKVEAPAHTFSFSNVVQNGYDFIWFLSPDVKFAQCTTPFAITVWDVAHRVHPYFPEVSLTGWKFDSREARYRDALPRASIVSIGTRVGAAQLTQFWGTTHERILINPLPVSPVWAASKGDTSILDRHGLTFSKYWLYPAQFWPHKNHVTAIDTLKILVENGADFRLIFTGHDMGNQQYVQAYAREQLPADRVIFAGFVSVPELVALYRNAYMLMFASVMGPDNLPPIEAMACGCPVVSAAYDGAHEQLKDGALFFSPLDAKDAAKTIGLVERNRQWLVQRGYEIAEERGVDRYVANIIKALDSMAKIRRLWGAGYTHL